MYKFKLVTRDCKTRAGRNNETDWRIGRRVEAIGDSSQGLCSDGWLHCYDSPELAVLLNPIHADIRNPRMMAVKVEGVGKSDRGLKCGYRAMIPVLFMDCPVFTVDQHIQFGIVCAKAAYTDATWVVWADGWLSGKDRSANAAYAAASAANAADAAADAAARAANAARAAAYAAAHAAAYAAADAAAYAANAAVYAADAANAAARAAAYVAADAADARPGIDLIVVADQIF